LNTLRRRGHLQWKAGRRGEKGLSDTSPLMLKRPNWKREAQLRLRGQTRKGERGRKEKRRVVRMQGGANVPGTL